MEENKNARHVQHVEVLTREEYRSGRSKTAQEGRVADPLAAAWTYSASAGCLPAVVTFVIFLVFFAEYGLLAAIGFAVIHLIGNGLGLYVQARKLMAGGPFNLWAWRVANWIFSFFITIWLAS